MAKIRPLNPTIEEYRMRVIQATINYLEANPLVQMELVDVFFTRRMRRLITRQIDQMLDEVTQTARTQTDHFGYPPQRA